MRSLCTIVFGIVSGSSRDRLGIVTQDRPRDPENCVTRVKGPEGETAPARLAAGEVLKYRKNKKDYFTFTIDI